MYILSKHRELLKQINIHERVETFRRNLASNTPPIFFENKSRKITKTCLKRKEHMYKQIM